MHRSALSRTLSTTEVGTRSTFLANFFARSFLCFFLSVTSLGHGMDCSARFFLFFKTVFGVRCGAQLG